MRRSPSLFALLMGCSLLFDCNSQAQPAKPFVTMLKGSRGRHRFTARFEVGPFRKALHHARVSGTTARIDGKNEWNKDGSKNWQGTDGGLPVTEFYSFRVTVDGKNWPVPKKLWADCYEPSVSSKNSETFSGRLSPDGRKLTLRMVGSDGAGAYYVVWHLRADGHHSREFRSTEEIN